MLWGPFIPGICKSITTMLAVSRASDITSCSELASAISTLSESCFRY